MQLSKRLHAVASLVSPGNRVADVGCDHAYTSIYLVEHKISPRVIAMDVNQGPIDRANENIKKYGYEDQIITRKSDGLEKLEPGEADTVLIAGMGGALTVEILTEKLKVVQTLKELVLQPQSEIYKVRRMLTDNGFFITSENMIKEYGKYYVMMKAEPEAVIRDKEKYSLAKEEHFQYGRLLLEQFHPVLKEFLLWDRSICGNILQGLEAEDSVNTEVRKREIREKIDLIDLGLTYYR